MSHRPTPGGIQRPDSSAFQALLFKRLTSHPAAPMNADRNRMFDMIKKRILSVEPKSVYDKKSIPIKSFSVTTDDPVDGKKKMELSFWLPINKGYSIHVNIDVNSLTEEDKENMEKVNFLDNSGKICSLYELYCYANGIPMSENMLQNFIMSRPDDRPEVMHRALKWALNHGTLVLTSGGNQNFLDIIEKAGSLSGYDDVQIPHILRTLSRSGLQLSNYGNGGGRGRQRRRGRTLLSRKKRNTRMKKSKKYNKSKKIKK
jgi:hypothetical protein